MEYTEISLSLKPEGLEDLLNELYANGIVDLVIEDPRDVDFLMDKRESYEWDYVDSDLLKKSEIAKVKIYLSKDEEGKKTFNTIKSILKKPEFSNVKPHSKVVNENDWKDVWKEFFKPAQITDKITIKPSWEHYEKKADDEIIIEIDPGMAFGTGTHETTTLCIKLLEKYADSEKEVLDVGSGSGILSIAAAKLGVKSVFAVDIDPVAVEVTKENLELNGITDVKVMQGDLLKGLDVSADILLANLMADLVIMLSGSAYKHLNADGIFISSGILLEKQSQVLAEIEKNNFEILEILKQGEWCAIAARKKHE